MHSPDCCISTRHPHPPEIAPHPTGASGPEQPPPAAAAAATPSAAPRTAPRDRRCVRAPGHGTPMHHGTPMATPMGTPMSFTAQVGAPTDLKRADVERGSHEECGQV